jgi:hypothetical protein
MDFVHKNSIVRQIWGKGDTILFIFAGASAEFALNKAVDWLYFTGKLPQDPIGRLFSTVSYARKIVFSPMESANKAIDSITAIHSAVEKSRGASIPDWAYRDVLFMLIHYSIASFELLERKLSKAEKEDVYDVFYRMGIRMGLKDLPPTFDQWLVMREDHLENNLALSHFTIDLFKQYRRHLGPMRYFLLRQGQVQVVPTRVNRLLSLGKFSMLSIVLPIYKMFRLVKLDWFIKSIVLPMEYKKQIRDLDVSGV